MCKSHVNQKRAHWPREGRDLATAEKELEGETLFHCSLPALMMGKRRRMCPTRTSPCIDVEVS